MCDLCRSTETLSVNQIVQALLVSLRVSRSQDHLFLGITISLQLVLLTSRGRDSYAIGRTSPIHVLHPLPSGTRGTLMMDYVLTPPQALVCRANFWGPHLIQNEVGTDSFKGSYNELKVRKSNVPIIRYDNEYCVMLVSVVMLENFEGK